MIAFQMRPSQSQSQSQTGSHGSIGHRPSSSSSASPSPNSHQYANYNLNNNPNHELNYSPSSLSPSPNHQAAAPWKIQSQSQAIHPSQYLQSQFYQPQPAVHQRPPLNHNFPNPHSSNYAPIPPPSDNRPYPFPQPPSSNRRQSTSGNRPQPPTNNSNPNQSNNAFLDPNLGRRRTTSHQPPPVSSLPNPSSSRPAHGAPGHEFDNCPGCRSEYEAAISASRASAEEEATRRARQEAQEEEEAKAISASQQEEALRRRKEEEEELVQVMEASRREHEEKRRLKEEEERIFMEESRQGALRDEEIRKRRETSQEQDVLERSRIEAEETKRRREAEEERMLEIEKMVMEESRKEQEEEWRRRDSEERAMLTGFQNNSNSQVEASYWDHHLRHDEAYKLALQFQEASLNGRANQAQASTSTLPPLPSSSNQRKRLPLPPTPESSAQVHYQSHSHSKAAEARLDRPLPQIDPFGDHAEAPPAYEPASPSPSTTPASPIIDVGSFEALIGTRGKDGRASAPPIEDEDDLDEDEMWVQQLSGNGRTPSRSSARQASPAPSVSRPASIAEVMYSGEENGRLSVSNSDDRTSTPIPSRSSSSASTSRQDLTFSPRPSFSSTAPTSLSNPPSPSIEKNHLAPESASTFGSRISSASHTPSPLPSPSLSPAVQSPASPPSPSTSTSASNSISEQPSTNTHVFKQTSLPGVDFGFARVPFSETLFIEPRVSEGSSSQLPTSDPSAKKTFPNTIQLTLPPLSGESLSTDPSNLIGVGGRGSFFVLRAQSWRGLLRAAAWFGNTRIEAGPEEIADAAALAKNGKNTSRNCRLKVEIEFVTPSRIEAGYGIGDYGRYSSTLGTGGVQALASAAKARIEREKKSAAHVSLCLSLVRPMGSTVGSNSSTSSNQQNPQGDLLSILKGESRSLDSIYLARGSTRRVIYLPREPPSLPLGMVALAQHLHRGELKVEDEAHLIRCEFSR